MSRPAPRQDACSAQSSKRDEMEARRASSSIERWAALRVVVLTLDDMDSINLALLMLAVLSLMSKRVRVVALQQEL